MEINAPFPVLLKAKAHMEILLRNRIDSYGGSSNPLWISSIDTETGRYPEDDSRPEAFPSRVYRDIAAPKGANPYWDLPQMVAAVEISQRTGNPLYAEKVNECLDHIFNRLLDAPSGLILWGNHYFYQAFRQQILFFLGSEEPSVYGEVPAGREGKYHELRPIPVPWELLWSRDAGKTERYVRALLRGHLVNPETGEFDRHAGASGQKHAFLEAGGILVHAAAFLYSKTGDNALLELANLFIRYTLGGRNSATGLVSNCPNSPGNRWDHSMSTTEIGHWAGALLGSFEYVPETTREIWLRQVDEVMTSWLEQAWDPEHLRFFGKLRIDSGKPVGTKSSLYEPGEYADLWEPLFPTHDYPMSLAETCLRLYRLTGKSHYQTACERWVKVILDSVPAGEGQGGYAEHYGRAIHFLLGSHRLFGRQEDLELAHRIAREADSFLWAGTMFRSHPGENRYDSVDGLGFLFLALNWLETGDQPDYQGFFF